MCQPRKRRQLLPRPRPGLAGSRGQRTAVVPAARPHPAAPVVPCGLLHPRAGYAAPSDQSGFSAAVRRTISCAAASAKHQRRSIRTVRTSTETKHRTIQPAAPRSLSTQTEHACSGLDEARQAAGRAYGGLLGLCCTPAAANHLRRLCSLMHQPRPSGTEKLRLTEKRRPDLHAHTGAR